MKKIFKLGVLLAAMMMAFTVTACSTSSGSGSEEEELLDGDYNGTGILDGETYWVSFFVKCPCEEAGYYDQYELGIYKTKSKNRSDLVDYIFTLSTKSLFINDTKIEYTNHFAGGKDWCMTSTDGKTYSGDYPYNGKMVKVTVTKKE